MEKVWWKRKSENGKLKGENGKVRGTPQSLRDSSSINKGVERGDDGGKKKECSQFRKTFRADKFRK